MIELSRRGSEPLAHQRIVVTRWKKVSFAPAPAAVWAGKANRSLPASAGDRPELLAFGEHGPGHAGVLGRDGDHGLPVPPTLGQRHGPAAEPIGLARSRRQHRTR